MNTNHQARYHVSRFLRTTLARIAFFMLLIVPFLVSRYFQQNDSEAVQAFKSKEQNKPQVIKAFGKLPMRFEMNQGQTDDAVRFLSRGKGFTLFLTGNEAVLTLRGASFGKQPYSDKLGGDPAASGLVMDAIEKSEPATVLRMQLIGAQADAEIQGLDELATKSNYFIGNNPERWQTGAPSYAKVKYTEVYPGIDLVYYGCGAHLEYDFVVAPGAKPTAITLGFKGANKLNVDENGDLIIEADGGEVTLLAPVIYQELDGSKQYISGRYALANADQVQFDIDPYDESRRLVIDPVLIYATFLGGNNSDHGEDIGLDAAGNIYILGQTGSSDFPTVNPIQASRVALDLFVSKFNPTGSTLLYSTYLGGSSGEVAGGLAVDAAGNAYLTGFTGSLDYPTANAFQGSKGDLSGGADVFVTKLSPDGSTLVYSTYLGGAGTDLGSGIAVDAGGHAYVTGSTISDDFPLANPFQGTIDTRFSPNDSFVSKFLPDGSGLVYSTYLGGSDFEFDQTIAVDEAGQAFVVGRTHSDDFPTANALQSSRAGGGDVFITKFNASGSGLIYSTYLGGSESEDGRDSFDFSIALDQAGNAYISGQTNSADFPTVNAFQNVKTNFWVPFVSKISADGSQLIYSTFLGGSKPVSTRLPKTESTGIAADAAGNTYVIGYTESSDFPVVDPLQGSLNGIERDLFITKFSPDGTILFSTYFGGVDRDEARGIFVDSSGTAYITGRTQSADFPTLDPQQPSHARAGVNDAFLIKIGEGASPITIAPESVIFDPVPGETARVTMEVANTGSGPLTIEDISVDPAPPFGLENVSVLPLTIAPDEAIVFDVTLSTSQSGAKSSEALAAVLQDGKLTIVSDAPGSPTTVQLQVRTITDMNFSGVAIDLDQPTPDFFPPQSDYIAITIKGSNLGKVNDIDFLPVHNNAIIPRNIKASDNEVTFELRVRHNAVLGNRDIVMFTDDFQEIQVSKILGAKFHVTAVRSQFNQGIDIKNQVVERDGRLDLFKDKLVAGKQGAVRIQFEDANQLNRVFEGALIETEANNTTEQVYVHRVKDDYDPGDLLIGLDYLTLPFPKPLKKGMRKFFYILERDDDLPILGPVIEKEAIESRELRIHAISYKITKPDGSVLMPPSDADVQQSLELLKKIYPISPEKIKFHHEGTKDFPDIGKFDDIFETSSTATHIKNTGRELLAKQAYEILDEANTEALFNDASDFHLQLVFLPPVGKDWAGVAYARFQTALIATTSSTKSVQKIVPHEIGHLLAAVLNKDFDLPESLQLELEDELGLGDEYKGGVYHCNVNPPIKQNKGWVNGKKDFCTSSPFDLNKEGDTVGIYTSLAAYNPYDQRPKFTDRNLSPEIINYNVMGSQGDAKTWVSNLTYSRLMKYLVPSAADNESIFRLASLQNDGIQINGVVLRDGGGSIDRVVKTTSHYRSPNAGGAYSIDLLDASNNILRSVTFSPTFVSVSEPPAESESELFNIQMDFDEQVQNVSLKKDGIELASFKISSNEPQVQILQPESHQMFTDGIEIKWSASDADGDSLEYSIIYETDDSVYLPVVAGLRDTSYTWNLVHFPGSLAGTIIVVANDGFHRARDRQTFGKARSAPTIAITAPKDGATVSSDSVLIIAATGYDLEDGLLPDSSFIFTSDVDGELGQGSPLIVSELSTGPHTITASATDKDGKTGFASVTISYLVTGVNEDAENRLPEDFALYQNYPNPFNASTIIQFDISKASDVNITIFNILGQRVQVLTDRKYPIGQHQLRWFGHDKSGLTVASGIYIYRIRVGDFIQSRKMLLLR